MAERPEDPTERRFRLWRDIILFVAGLALLVYEVLHHDTVERPMLLVFFASMMGLPIFLRKDESTHG